MFDDDEDDILEMSEAEAWYDNNLRFFDWKNKATPGLPLDVELFYHSMYVPFKKELKEPLRQLVNRHYKYIATECRPEVLARIERKIDWVGHEFILFLRNMVEFWKTGKDLREIFPKLDEWAITYSSYRKPRYLDLSFWDKLDWLSEEQKQTMIEEEHREADELFAFKEKPRSEFYDLIQNLTFKYYAEVQELDTDGWVMFEVFMRDEYTNYQLDFEHYDEFIEYGFDVEDLNLPYKEYSVKFSERWKERWEEEQRKKEDENKKQKNEE
ncbi:MAG: hypothetical protein PHR83_18520 [Paludibacter sp.]|nr:hypothetical protein [Paludibacter sp.]